MRVMHVEPHTMITASPGLGNNEGNLNQGKDDLDEEWDEEELCKIFLGWDF